MTEIFVEFVESQPWKHQNRSRIKLSEPLDEEVVKTKYDRYILKIGAGKFLSQFSCDLPTVFAVEFVLKFLRFRSRQYAKILKLPAHFQRNIAQQMTPFWYASAAHKNGYGPDHTLHSCHIQHRAGFPVAAYGLQEIKLSTLKAFQDLVEYPVFLYHGFTFGEFTKCHPIPQKRPPHRCLGCLELQFENSARLGQSYSGNN